MKWLLGSNLSLNFTFQKKAKENALASEGKSCRPETITAKKSLCVSRPLSLKKAAKITFAQFKRRTLQSIIYRPEEKNHWNKQHIIWYKVIVVCCLPTPFFSRKKGRIYKGKALYREKTVYPETHKTAIYGPWTTQEGSNTHLSKVSCFFIEILSFSKVTETIGFFPIQILIFRMLHNNDDVRRCSYFELGLPVVWTAEI